MRTALWLVIPGLVVVAILQMMSIEAAAAESRSNGEITGNRPESTYERFLPLALAGDPDIQNLLGFMYFYGEGVEPNYDDAHYWFHLAAEEGDFKAQRNLGIFHSRLLPRIPEKYFDSEEANLWFSLAAASSRDPAISTLVSRSYDKFLAADAEKLLKETEKRHIGETIFVTLCAGCHGFDGHAPYTGAPSFALGQRLEQSNRVLVDSILNGKGLMSAWGSTLSKEMALATVSYIRRFNNGATDSAQVAGLPTPVQQLALDPGNEPAPAEKTYLQFCGGCHGFNGIAWYVNSPSFALRERMHKSDAELADSISNGLGVMPSWENMLLPRQIDALVKYIRTLSETYERGIGNELRPSPDLFFRFRPVGETGPEWNSANPENN
jgi:mono/diheme cytochrome c family protein